MLCCLILMTLGACTLQTIEENDLIGRYQSVLSDGKSGLPDGGSEMLELKSDGTCKQDIRLKGGRTFSTKATWTYDKSERTISVRGAYVAVISADEINPDVGKTTDTLHTMPVGYKWGGGGILLGLDGSAHYEKM